MSIENSGKYSWMTHRVQSWRLLFLYTLLLDKINKKIKNRKYFMIKSRRHPDRVTPRTRRRAGIAGSPLPGPSSRKTTTGRTSLIPSPMDSHRPATQPSQQSAASNLVADGPSVSQSVRPRWLFLNILLNNI